MFLLKRLTLNNEEYEAIVTPQNLENHFLESFMVF